MIFIWRGLGWLSIVLFAAVLITCAAIARSIDKNYPEHLVSGAGTMLTGGLIAVFAILVLPALAKRKNPTVQFWAVQKNHSLFWIPMIWWSVIVTVLGGIWILFGAPAPINPGY